MPTTTSSQDPLEALRVVESELREAVAAEDLEGALAMLPRHRAALERARESAADRQTLWAESQQFLQSCLRMVHTHRQESLDAYSRLSGTDAYRTGERVTGTWGLDG